MIEKYLIKTDFTVKQAIEFMETNLVKAVVIVDDERRVKGLFSNGDMRTFFLKGGCLSDNISRAMNLTPHLYSDRKEVEKEREEFYRVIYPITDSEGKIIDIIDYNQTSVKGIMNDSLANVPLVIMAGGKGSRLYPYTKVLPKPLIPIGDYTITERIINNFRKYGCKNIYMVLNYKANMIRAYMNDLDKDYSISYVEESDFLGTAGGLGLLKGAITSTFFLSNCDILVDADFDCIYKTHKKKGNKITFVCSMKDILIPYGVVETDESGMIVNMKEKPEFSFLVNTGLYMIEPDVLDDIKEGEFIHLPDLAKRYLEKGEKVGVFPVSEKSWMDMGQFAEMDNMLKQLGVN